MFTVNLVMICLLAAKYFGHNTASNFSRTNKTLFYPDVVLESAPMTTPPSNSIAAIVVYNRSNV